MDESPVVLVAEDDASVRMTLEFVLEDEGFVVLIAEDGEQALILATEQLPDVILLDQIMPKMNGKQVYSALQRHPATSAIPVLVLTGMHRDSEGWKGAHFVGKPFSPEFLVDKIRSVLAQTQA
jgi:two-component system phosphate regulon response regulator PhoB